MSFDLSKQLTQLLFIFIVILSIALSWYGYACGLLVTSDSYQYLSAAQSFKTNGVFLSPDGSYYTYWPPLFPVILSGFENPAHALMWINVMVKISIGFLILFLANEFFEKNLVKVLFLLVSLCSVQMTMISVFLWSELIFLFLLLLVVSCALKMKTAAFYFYGLLVFGFLLCLQRNAGAFFILALSTWIFLDKDIAIKDRLIKSTLVFAVGLLGLWVWNIYISFFTPSDFYFYKHNFFSGLAVNFTTLSTTLSKFFAPGLNSLANLLGIVMFSVLIVYSIKAKLKVRRVQLVGLLIFFYCLCMMLLGKLDIHETDRYMSVIVPFVYLMSFFMLERGLAKVNSVSQYMIMALLCLWLVYPIVRTVKNVRLWNERSCLAYPAK